jgi:hypothetical protein
MTDQSLTPNETLTAAVHIATLRGLYGDFGLCLHNVEERILLWRQILEEHHQLSRLLSDVVLEPGGIPA